MLWIWHEQDFEYECSACKCRFDYSNTYGIFHHSFENGDYCPNCGAKMDGENADQREQHTNGKPDPEWNGIE